MKLQKTEVAQAFFLLFESTFLCKIYSTNGCCYALPSFYSGFCEKPLINSVSGDFYGKKTFGNPKVFCLYLLLLLFIGWLNVQYNSDWLIFLSKFTTLNYWLSYTLYNYRFYLNVHNKRSTKLIATIITICHG